MLNRGNFTSIIAQSPLRPKMPKDDEDDHITKNGQHGSKKVTFALNDILHELNDGEDIEEEQRKPVRRKAPSYLLGHPLADYDATDSNLPSPDTYLVLSKRLTSSSYQAYRFNLAESLYCMGPVNPVRILAIRIVTHSFFEIFVMIIITINCIILALNDPPEDAEYLFTAIYTLEMVLKILSRGFILHTYAYLRDAWNWLDFVVVFLSYLSIAPNIQSFSGIRTLRVLRAFRTISALKGLRTMVNSLLRSLKLLSDVLVLFMFSLCVLALIGLQLFSGELRNKCVRTPLPNSSVGFAVYINNASQWFYDGNSEPLVCGNSSNAGQCPENYTCISGAGPNPDQGYTNFDNMGWSLVMAFQILTMDYWENLYDRCLRSMGTWYVMYFIVGIFSCSFYLLNLVLAVVYMSYHHEMMSSKNEVDRSSKKGNKKPPETQRKQNKKVAASYAADLETIQRLEPLEAHLYPPDYESDEEENIQSENEDNDEKICEPNTILEKLYVEVSKFVMSPLFDGIVTGLILLNTVVLSMYYHGMGKEMVFVLDTLNAVFTGIFLLEMVLKIAVIGFSTYIRNKWNIFDGVIIFSSVVAYFLENSSGISMFRILRLLRILYLGQSWETMAKLIRAIAHSVDPILNITCILGVIIYVFAVMGMRIFGPSYTEENFGPEGVPRWNLKDFAHAFMMVFRILCSEWVEPLWDCMKVTGPAALFFFLPCLIVGNFIVLNLFVALLLNSFAIKEEEPQPKEEKTKRKEKSSGCRYLMETKKTRMYVATFRERYKLYQVKVLESSRATEPGIVSPLQERFSDVAPKGHKMEQMSRCGSASCSTTSNEGHRNPSPKRYIIEIDDCFPQCCMVCSCPSGQHFCWLKFRCRVRCFVEHRYFEWFILSAVMISSLVLVFEDIHLHEKPELQQILKTLNFLFAVIFSLEFFFKLIGFGVVKYFTSVWNCLDALIVSVSVACLFENPNLSVFRSFRTIRALRPLRAISRMEGMKVVINALFAAIPGIGNVLVISLLFWLMFSILGVQLFAGKFFRCVDENNEMLSPSVIANKTDCLAQYPKYRWTNAHVNFDNVCNGFLALLQVATYEGWMEVMAAAVDSTEVDQQPSFEANMYAYVYFVVFIIVGSFFVLNLFVGVIIDNFNTLKKKYEEISSMGMFLTESQRKWVQILVAASKKKPPSKKLRPSDCFRGKLFDLVTSNNFEVVILMVIMSNMGLMMAQHYDQSPEISNVMTFSLRSVQIANFILVGIFLMEAIVKLIAMRHHYFKKAWNIFDFTVVVSSVVGIVLDEMNTEESEVVNAGLLRVIRVFRVARLLRVVQFAKRIRQLLVAIIISIPALFNIGTLLFLIMYIYAIIGMASFGNVKKQGELDDFVNFETFGKSMMLIFRLSTGTGWNDILDALMVQPPHCDPQYNNLPNGNCGYIVEAVLYLVSYIIVVFLIIVNMYIAVLLDNVNRAHETDDFGLSKDKFKSFYNKFANFSLGKQYIPVTFLPDLLDDLDKPFRIPKPNEEEIDKLAIPVREGSLVHCFDVLKALVKRILQDHGESPEMFEQITVRMEAQFKKSFSKKVSAAIIGSTLIRFHSNPINTQQNHVT